MKDMKKGREKSRKQGLDDDQIVMLCSLVFQTQIFAVEYKACLQAAISESIEHDPERVLTKIRSSLEDRARRAGAPGARRAHAAVLDDRRGSDAAVQQRASGPGAWGVPEARAVAAAR